MKALIQRVKNAKVTADGTLSGSIDQGILVFVGFTHDDTKEKITRCLEKILKVRIFEDEQHKLNLNLQQANGALLIVSQFTLYGDLKKGNRPGFDAAMKPDEAEKLYDFCVAEARRLMGDESKVQTGVFGAFMEVELNNDGPCTFMLEY